MSSHPTPQCLNPHTFRKPSPREHSISRWLSFYNYQRPHSALGWLNPIQKLRSFPAYQGVTHVRQQYIRISPTSSEPSSKFCPGQPPTFKPGPRPERGKYSQQAPRPAPRRWSLPGYFQYLAGGGNWCGLLAETPIHGASVMA
ncbi:MAG: transposase, partial [Chloroflexi bacterium]|nr:transposase [Chloroflexota bacterium]